MRDPKNLQGDAKPATPPEGINLAFAMEMAKMSAVLDKLMVGRRHLCMFLNSYYSSWCDLRITMC